MAFTRAFEEHEVPPDLKRLYADLRASFDLPFVPTAFKLLAASPEYLKLMWSDMGPLARSKEFHLASRALEEMVRSLVVRGGWRFADQQKILAAQKFTVDDMEALGAIPAIFTRTLCQMAVFTRLMQRGYSGGQGGRTSENRQASALSRMISLHVPNEREASLRVWLIYSEIKKTTNSRNVISLFRVLAPFPGYLASMWLDSKKLLADPSLGPAREQLAKRIAGLLIGLPVKDHRAAGKHIAPGTWRDIEETVDGIARLVPQFALLSEVWRRSLPQYQSAVA
jgi:hypothetical protein